MGVFYGMPPFPLLEQLNQAQREAVLRGHGHLCINAAAGTGKTSTLAARILHLQLERGIPPAAILAVTFSRSARAHLLQRVEEYIEQLGSGSVISTLTFHGLAYRLLRMAVRNDETWLRPDFKVLDATRDGLNPIFEEHGSYLVEGLTDKYPYETRLPLYQKALDLIRQGHHGLEQAVISPKELEDLGNAEIVVSWGQGHCSPVLLGNVQRVWERYRSLLKRFNCIDFPGMLSECLHVMYNEGSTLKEFQAGLRFLIIDEYQDTSRAQEELIGLLAGDRVSVNVVGDTNQTIYTFNGSDANNMHRFYERRSASRIPLLDPVELTWNYRSTPNIIAVANRVISAGQSTGPLEPAQHGVSDNVANYRRRNAPVLQVFARQRTVAAEWVAKEIAQLLSHTDVKPHEIAVLVRKDTEHAPQGQLVRKALDVLGLVYQVQNRDPQRTALVLDVVHSFLNDNFGEDLESLVRRVQAGQCEEDLSGITPPEALAVLEEARRAGAFSALEAADLVFDMASPDQSAPDITGIQIRTVHSAKGLEFRIVFLMYLGDGDFPSGSRPDLEEERRLLYVGITRAMERLYVLGRPGVKFPSFFDEIKGEGVDCINAQPPDQVSAKSGVDAESLQQVAAARLRLREEEERRRNRRQDSDGEWYEE